MTTKSSIQKWWILTAMTILMVTLALDYSAVNLALVPIANDIHINLAGAQWIMNGFFTGCAVFTAIAGKLGDIFSKRLILIIGALIFLLASLGTGISQNEWSIIIARIAQGIGVAFCFPMIYAINFAVFPAEQRGVALGILTTGNGMAQAFGPAFGAFIIKLLSWRWIFFINIPVVLFSILITLLYYKPQLVNNINKRIDQLGIILLVVGLFALTFALNESHVWGINSVNFIAWLLFSLLILASFSIYQLRIQQPLLDLHLFKNSLFTLSNLIRISYQYVFNAQLFLLTFFLQNVLNYSVAKASFYLLFITIVFAITSPLAGRWVDRVGVKVPIIIAMSLMIIECLLFLVIGLSFTVSILILALFLLGIATGIILPSTSLLTIKACPPEKTGLASGIFYTNMFLSTAVSLAITGFVLSVASKKYLQNSLAMHNIKLSVVQINSLNNIAVGVRSYATENLNISQPILNQLHDITYHAFMFGFNLNTWIFLVSSIFGLGFSLVMARKMKLAETAN